MNKGMRLREVTEPLDDRVVGNVLVEKSEADGESKQAGWRHGEYKPAHQRESEARDE